MVSLNLKLSTAGMDVHWGTWCSHTIWCHSGAIDKKHCAYQSSRGSFMQTIQLRRKVAISWKIVKTLQEMLSPLGSRHKGEFNRNWRLKRQLKTEYWWLDANKVVPPAGFEPAAPGLGILCSIPWATRALLHAGGLFTPIHISVQAIRSYSLQQLILTLFVWVGANLFPLSDRK